MFQRDVYATAIVTASKNAESLRFLQAVSSHFYDSEEDESWSSVIPTLPRDVFVSYIHVLKLFTALANLHLGGFVFDTSSQDFLQELAEQETSMIASPRRFREVYGPLVLSVANIYRENSTRSQGRLGLCDWAADSLGLNSGEIGNLRLDSGSDRQTSARVCRTDRGGFGDEDEDEEGEDDDYGDVEDETLRMRMMRMDEDDEGEDEGKDEDENEGEGEGEDEDEEGEEEAVCRNDVTEDVQRRRTCACLHLTSLHHATVVSSVDAPPDLHEARVPISCTKEGEKKTFESSDSAYQDRTRMQWSESSVVSWRDSIGQHRAVIREGLDHRLKSRSCKQPGGNGERQFSAMHVGVMGTLGTGISVVLIASTLPTLLEGAAYEPECHSPISASLPTCHLAAHPMGNLLQRALANQTQRPFLELSANPIRECDGEIPEKTRRPEASSGTNPTCENPGATPPEIEPSSPRRKSIALAAKPLRPPVVEWVSPHKMNCDDISALYLPTLRPYSTQLHRRQLPPPGHELSGWRTNRRAHVDRLRNHPAIFWKTPLIKNSPVRPGYRIVQAISLPLSPPVGFASKLSAPLLQKYNYGYGAVPECAGRGSGRSPRKPPNPTISFDTIRTYENPESNQGRFGDGRALCQPWSLRKTDPGREERERSGYQIPTAFKPGDSQVNMQDGVSEGIWKAPNNEVSRADEDPGTIPTCGNPVIRPGIEPGSPWWEASVLTSQPPRPRWEEFVLRASSDITARFNWLQSKGEIIIDVLKTCACPADMGLV
ncbi:hypothetical protein PR048_027138 [Dryococelus australis]|uniref:Uncharacterized protein n=1 Tax=Dryococelus australis TaxID=614101 RepID=A0ABQ9GG93_9NEOP|nr:hypothetical protein PR048_027138 [Dryococelus australis]